jgi:hypothetical protein
MGMSAADRAEADERRSEAAEAVNAARAATVVAADAKVGRGLSAL